MTARSYLYVPADRPEKLEKAAARGADALILDLEDSVALEEKPNARRLAKEWIETADRTVETWVRTNAGDLLAEDLQEILPAGPDGILLSKVSSAEEVDHARSLAGKDVRLAALIETAAGVLNAREIAASGVERLAIGEADLSAELGIMLSDDGREVNSIRMQIVLVSAAAGIDAPVGPVSTDFRDLDALRTSTEALKRVGFSSRAAIHPAQVSVINEVFMPSHEEVAAARRIIARFEEAGGAACVDDSGRMVDEAVVRSARRTLSTAE